MRQRCRLICSRSSLYVYVTAIALFTLCNILAIILISRSSKQNDHPIAKINAEPLFPLQDGGLLIGNLLSSFVFNFNQSSSRTDSKRTYIIHDSVVVGNAYGSYGKAYVTLATQCSVDKLHMLFELADTWRAPMSVAVFVPGVDFYIAKVYIAYLRLCSQVIRTNVTFHFLYHRDMAPSDSSSSEHAHDHHAVPSCARSSEALPLLLRYRTSSFRRWWQQALHPQNHLRNVARKGVKTPYHFLTDIDILPIAGLAHQLDVFLSTSSRGKSCSKCVFVVPTYEMPEQLPVPRSKDELLERIRRKQSRPFHAKVFIHNQFATNHSLWEKIPNSRQLEAAYKISNYEFFYEPFYVGRANVPLYDERFIGYGFTRNTQVFEMHLAGFDFWVLNPAFAIHRGVQNKRGRGAWRERQNVINRKQFIRFKNEMAIKYRSRQKADRKIAVFQSINCIFLCFVQIVSVIFAWCIYFEVVEFLELPHCYYLERKR
ncbi:beta-1,4-glucuronyltransferase 1 [Trichonephila clavata]|uniref:Beta-1,4-glucuronyltransferase 1 n=1 Tax=Trichonephila clavata TaxID=2740835 RepID=A0A8X6GD98_TRICU|nr:beta-1,4-glucuronyltransferase 1 [Trichonephila clavata]